MELQNEIVDEKNDEKLSAGHWMTPYPHIIEAGKTYREAAIKIEKYQLSCLPVVDELGHPVGLITLKKLMNLFLHGNPDEKIKSDIRIHDLVLVKQDANLLELFKIPHKQFLVVDDSGQLVGILTNQDILDGFSKYIYKLEQTENKADALNVILEKAYEGIAVVDENGVLLEFNEAYSRFTGVKREEAIGRHVTEVIENTNLHMTVKTAIPDRGVLQVIQGQPMVVHRIPLWKNGKVVGAIGMLIFEGVSEVYEILDRLQREKIKNKTETKMMTTEIAEDSRITMDQIIGTSESILQAKRLARKAARTAATILISGESGTGKEVFAKSIHHLSPYYNGPFISVNCGAIPENLFESELFGYEEGAFTGAKKEGKPGKFELAQNGTIFLDEIGELSLLLQTKLLRVLQEREAERVGSIKKYSVDVRVIAATNRNLEQMVEDGTFREDLYYRLNIIRLHLPPLRDRKEDIPTLLAHFSKEICAKYDIMEKQFTSAAVASLVNNPWKGNIRELVNTIEQSVIMSDKDMIDVSDLPKVMRKQSTDDPEMNLSLIEQAKSVGEEAEKQLILQTLKEVGGNKSQAAIKLGIHRTTLYQRLRKYNIR
ncbi:sigma-54-dependent Fis family transcriptional regulator [Sporosarcina jiandibaonis]|uniref:sigma-54-dependent Fis family transcriptional regulator n=1 Tax=Sporosarcina jiandibaonis TaxID=2715535 RepID=UPI0015557A7C|nr:sigma-54-dependent Fis family transcriptional regulator [Sporosarcina jiandibaonis]